MSYSLDPTGRMLQNQVIGEAKVLNLPVGRTYLFVVPDSGPFFEGTMRIKLTPVSGPSRNLEEGVDWVPAFQFADATAKCNLPVYGCIKFVNIVTTGTIQMVYQSLGGQYLLTQAQVASIQAMEARDPELTIWEKVLYDRAIPRSDFPVVDFPWALVNVDAVRDVTARLEEVGIAVQLRPKLLSAPGPNVFIPTASEIGLGNVPNYRAATNEESKAGTASNLLVTPAGLAASVNQKVTERLLEIGYRLPIEYSAGLSVTDSKQTYSYNGNVYAPRRTALPFVTNGAFESPKFILVTANDRDRWQGWSTMITGGEEKNILNGVILHPTLSLTAEVDSRLILNRVLELVYKVDYHIDGDSLVVHYPLLPQDELRYCIKRKENRMANDKNYYKIIRVVDSSKVYTLTDMEYYDAEDLRFTLNDFIVLYKDIDYAIAGNQLTITYPLKLDDIIEIENIDSTPFLGRHQLRSILRMTSNANA